MNASNLYPDSSIVIETLEHCNFIACLPVGREIENCSLKIN